MYESFYGLAEKPFALTPDPAFLYLSKRHQNGLTMLQYGLTLTGSITVITGEVGSGKTTLMRHVLRSLDPQFTIGYLTNTHPNIKDLLKWILMAFGLNYRNKDEVELYESLITFIIEQYAENKRTLLIIDEAQNMSPATLEELRMLSNLNAGKDHVLQLVLIGQPELAETLRKPELRQFAQRISVDYHLTPLTQDETTDYIRHRLITAGGDPRLFTKESCQTIHHYAQGIPRLINTLCEMALVYGYADDQKTITPDVVHEVVTYRQRGSVNPYKDRPASQNQHVRQKTEAKAMVRTKARQQADLPQAAKESTPQRADLPLSPKTIFSPADQARSVNGRAATLPVDATAERPLRADAEVDNTTQNRQDAAPPLTAVPAEPPQSSAQRLASIDPRALGRRIAPIRSKSQSET